MSENASAAASPTTQARQAAEPAPSQAVPHPEAPPEGALVDAQAVPFAWTEVPGASGYVLQVAADADFEDVLVSLSTGPTTALTLYDTLAARDETDLHWRVRTEQSKQWGPAACLRLVSERVIAERQAERERAAAERAEAFVRQATADIHRPEEDASLLSDRRTLVVLAMIVLSFLVLLVVLFMFGQVMYPPEATGL